MRHGPQDSSCLPRPRQIPIREIRSLDTSVKRPASARGRHQCLEDRRPPTIPHCKEPVNRRILPPTAVSISVLQLRIVYVLPTFCCEGANMRTLTGVPEMHVSRLPLVVLLLGVACHRTTPRASTITASRWPTEQHCWWAAFRTTMPPDSVETRFETALEAIGFARGHRGSLGDTSWAQAGPQVLPAPETGVYASRVVAIRLGDSTRTRIFVGGDSVANARSIPMCAEIMRRATLRAFAPRDEERDDSAPQWRRRP